MSLFPNFRVWHMLNQDTGQLLSGQFEPDTVSEERGSVYAERFTLNRKKAILQFLHGKTPLVSFTGMFYNETVLGPTSGFGVASALVPTFGDVRKNLATLQSWSERDPKFGRPPIILFWIGDGWINTNAVIESVNVAHLKPAFLGAFKGAKFTVAMREFTPFDPEAKGLFDTRIHKTKKSEYYELIAQREYREPLIGVILRQRNPSKINLTIGDSVRLPAGTGTIRQEPITQSSIIFQTAFDKQRDPSPQQVRHQTMVDARNKSKLSHILAA